MPDKDKDKVEVRTFNWGPCLIHLQIKDDFKKILLDEAAKNEKDFSSKLAGQIRKETGYSDESRDKIVPYLAPYLGVYDQMFQKYQTKKYSGPRNQNICSCIYSQSIIIKINTTINFNIKI